jgi:hypothetical protein
MTFERDVKNILLTLLLLCACIQKFAAGKGLLLCENSETGYHEAGYCPKLKNVLL